MRVRKAVIPAAGLGTRLFPATRTMPKEMFPLIDRPAIQYVVEEAAASGFRQILILTRSGKSSIEDHFDQLADSETIASGVDIYFLRQKQPRGLGHAVYCAREFVGQEPFAVLLPDVVICGTNRCLGRLAEVFELTGSSVIAVHPVEPALARCYGIVKPAATSPLEPAIAGAFLLEALVEKPDPREAPSNLAITGRYLLHPEVFEDLATLAGAAGGEIQLTDALCRLAARREIYGLPLEGTLVHVGDRLGYLRATVEMGLSRPDLAPGVRRYVLELADRLLKELPDPPPGFLCWTGTKGEGLS